MVLDGGELPGLYLDTALEKSSALYAQFICRLHEAGLIRFDLIAKSIVGAFCVHKQLQGVFDS